MAKHARPETTQAASPFKDTALGGSHIGTWASNHPTAATLLLAALCLAAFCLIFYFIVFSDFSASADFIYNQF